MFNYISSRSLPNITPASSNEAGDDECSIDEATTQKPFGTQRSNKAHIHRASFIDDFRKRSRVPVTDVKATSETNQIRNKNTTMSSNLRVELLIQALSHTDKASSASDAWEIIFVTINALGFKGRDGKNWTIPGFRDPRCRMDSEGRFSISLIGHHLVICPDGSYRINEVGFLQPIFQKSSAADPATSTGRSALPPLR